MEQLRALNKPLFTIVNPYKSDAADGDENSDNGNLLFSKYIS